MEPFGPFEAGRVLDSGNGATVYEARKEGEPKGQYAVKLFSAERLVSDEEQEAHSALDPLFKDLGASFTERVTLQKKAGAGSSYFIPILAAGHDQRGAWYATRFYARSVKGMLERFIALEPADLHHVLHSVVRAALHLKQACGRSHGNLKPANVFIDGLRRPRSSKVMVADPLPGGEQEAANYEKADLRAIGELLYQLVARRKVDFAWVMVPIESTPDWSKAFGKHAPAWLDLCNRLLDPNLLLEELSLDSLDKELRRLKPKPPVPVVPLAIATVVLAVAGLASFLIFHKRTTGTVLVQTDPPGARVILIPVDVDGNEDLAHSLTNTSGPNGSWKHSAEKGPYKLKLEYRSALGDLEPSRRVPLTVEAGKTFRTNLSLPYGGLIVGSEPSGAEFKLQEQVFHTPFTNRYAHPADLELQLRLEGYETTNLTVTVPSNHTLVTLMARLRKPPPGSSLVELASDPPGAELFLDGVSIGKTPRRVAVEVGRHEIAVELAPWFERQSRTIEVRKDQGQAQSFYLPHGQLWLTNIIPAVAQVFINDRAAGLAPTNFSLPPGSYSLELRAAGYETNRLTVAIQDKGFQVPAVALKALAGFVDLISDPPGAEIRDAGNKVLGVTGPDGAARIPLPPGVYSLRATYANLAPVEKRNVEVKAGQVTSLGQLAFDYGAAVFDIQPPDARTNAVIRRPDQKVVAIGDKSIQLPGENVAYTIEAPGYVAAATNLNLAARQTRLVAVALARRAVPVRLASTPPGLRFFDGATELRPTGENYSLTWGTHEVVARHPRLGAQTNRVTITLDGPNNIPPFQFVYGTLVLTNLGKDMAVLEGQSPVGTPADQVVYEPLGRHSYILKGRFRSEVVVTNILAGLNFLQSTAPKGVFSGIGMELVQVKALPGVSGDAFVGKCEVTQGEYARVMSGNAGALPEPKLPMSNVTAQNAEDFCKKLSELDKNTPDFPPGYVYVLPTVAQWDALTNACDPGLGVFSPDLSHRLQGPSPVGSKGPDGNGLCDLFGNVWEICRDPARGGYRIRGGSYSETSKGWKLVFRDDFVQASTYIGFRVLLVPAGQ